MALLASHGYAALAVAYFGIAPLPDDLDRIPLETVDRAVAWLRAQPSVDPKRIAIWGGSKGAELALVAASRNPAIRAVVAVVDGRAGRADRSAREASRLPLSRD
ncbi:MAG TPA: acyl-CoA thioester hydrolase/BAAT C-terminal domain-containing protein [Thermoanaerobaculia bacterium]|nr:acyl-CoA thioester hydrolase/BAAT C-terminal domain-containing protein [Thermoanaerobaculia bacterium]